MIDCAGYDLIDIQGKSLFSLGLSNNEPAKEIS